MKLDKLDEGERILFNDRSIPLEVEEVDENRVHIKGPNGGEYIIFRSEEGNLLVRNKQSSRRYASYVEDLRRVGKWKKDGGKTWKHSKSGAEIQIDRTEAGFWTLQTDLEIELDLPKYGFSDREFAEKEAKRIIRENPEG